MKLNEIAGEDEFFEKLKGNLTGYDVFNLIKECLNDSDSSFYDELSTKLKQLGYNTSTYSPNSKEIEILIGDSTGAYIGKINISYLEFKIITYTNIIDQIEYKYVIYLNDYVSMQEKSLVKNED